MDQILLDIFNFREAISESMVSTSLKGNGTATGHTLDLRLLDWANLKYVFCIYADFQGY